MNEAFYHQTHRVEHEHWWFVHRRRLVRDLIESWAPSGRMVRGLDVGCGSGGNLELLGRFCDQALGLDRCALPLQLARRADARRLLVQADANRLAAAFRPESFDLITIFNVLYHRWVRDDQAVLRDVGELLRPGGLLVITEPANPSLFRRHDVVDFGVRRYTRAKLRGLVEGAGLSVMQESYFNSVALPAALLSAAVDRLTGRLRRPVGEGEEVGELRTPPRPINRALLRLMTLERRCLTVLGRVPLGVGLILVATRRAADLEGERGGESDPGAAHAE